MAYMTHVLIAKTAKELAGAFYDHTAHNNEFYSAWPNEKQFITTCWARFIPVARQVLTDVLTQNDVSDKVKERIFEALLHERGIPDSDEFMSRFKH